MSAAKLCEFFEKEIQDCFDNGEHLNGITSFLLPSIGWSVRQSFFLILGISVTLKKNGKHICLDFFRSDDVPSHEGHNDEGVGSHHLRPLRQGLLQGWCSFLYDVSGR